MGNESMKPGAEYAEWTAPGTETKKTADPEAAREQYQPEKKPDSTKKAEVKAHDKVHEAKKVDDPEAAREQYKAETKESTGADDPEAAREQYKSEPKKETASKPDAASKAESGSSSNPVDRGEAKWKKDDGLDGRKMRNEKGHYTTMDAEHERAFEEAKAAGIEIKRTTSESSSAEAQKTSPEQDDLSDIDIQLGELRDVKSEKEDDLSDIDIQLGESRELTPAQFAGRERIQDAQIALKKLGKKGESLWAKIKKAVVGFLSKKVESMLGMDKAIIEKYQKAARSIERTGAAAKKSMEAKCQRFADNALEGFANMADNGRAAREAIVNNIQGAEAKGVAAFFLIRAEMADKMALMDDKGARSAEDKMNDQLSARDSKRRLARAAEQKARDLLGQMVYNESGKPANEVYDDLAKPQEAAVDTSSNASAPESGSAFDIYEQNARPSEATAETAEPAAEQAEPVMAEAAQSEAEPAEDQTAETASEATQAESLKYVDGKELTPAQVKGRERAASAIGGLKRVMNAIRPRVESMLGADVAVRNGVENARKNIAEKVKEVTGRASERFNGVVEKGRAKKDSIVRGIKNSSLQFQANRALAEMARYDAAADSHDVKAGNFEQQMLIKRESANKRREAAREFRRLAKAALDRHNQTKGGTAESSQPFEAQTSSQAA